MTPKPESMLNLLVFNVGDRRLALPARGVREVIRAVAIAPLPKAPPIVEGVINLRGRVIPVIDLRTRFGLERAERGDATRIIVVEVSDHTVGMVVDGVSEVIRLSADAIEPTGEIMTSIDVNYLRGVGKLNGKLVILVDLRKVLTTSEVQELGAAQAAD